MSATDDITRSILPNSMNLFEKTVRRSKGYSKQPRKQKLNGKATLKVSATKDASDFLRDWPGVGALSVTRRKRPASVISIAPSPIFSVDTNAMSMILSYLEPTEALSFVTMPLSKTWRSTYYKSEDLWKVLCIAEPFNANYNDISIDKHGSTFHFYDTMDSDMSRYRLIYTSFVQCYKYLAKIKEDAQLAHKPSSFHTIPPPSGLTFQKSNSTLGCYLEQAQSIVKASTQETDSAETEASYTPIGVIDDGRISENPKKKIKCEDGPKLGQSILSQRLLKRPSRGTSTGLVNLPWSCAIYSVVNWMISFADVIGIQIICLKTLPFLLEDDKQRTTALNAGLVDIVLTIMEHFPNNAELHIASLHALVILARPMGGKEGMLLNGPDSSTMKSYFFTTSSGKNGITIMLDSLRRFKNNEILQATGCWSMVNISLRQDQKVGLIDHGGIATAMEAMRNHPSSAEVNFRALFALINLVILPAVTSDDDSIRRTTAMKSILDSHVDQIISLTVGAMLNFGDNVAVLNRACLVLHNISLSMSYHPRILFATGCYEALRACLINHRGDKVLQQGASGTLRRLHASLAGNNDLRSRFFAQIRPQESNESPQMS